MAAHNTDYTGESKPPKRYPLTSRSQSIMCWQDAAAAVRARSHASIRPTRSSRALAMCGERPDAGVQGKTGLGAVGLARFAKLWTSFTEFGCDSHEFGQSLHELGKI